MRRNNINSFTLIELLIVIAILAVLAAAVVIVLNPAELLAQARDSQRISDMESLKKSVDLFVLDNPTVSLGTSQRVYISIPDTSSSCANITGLSALPAGWQYACVTSANLRNINGTGWVPVNFSNIYGGSPIPRLPIDPTNDATSGKYYTYVMGGSYGVSALLESEKYFGTKDGGSYPELFEAGTDLSLLPVSHDPSLVGYWKFDGTGSISNSQTTSLEDYSGNSNNGTAVNTNGSGMSFVAGKIGNAVQFDGVDDYVRCGTAESINNNQIITFSFWAKPDEWSGSRFFVSRGGYQNNGWYVMSNTSGGISTRISNVGNATDVVSSPSKTPVGQWTNVVIVLNNGNYADYYFNGFFDKRSSSSLIYAYSSSMLTIGAYSTGGYYAKGLIDDLRIYNRALSSTEITAMYESGR